MAGFIDALVKDPSNPPQVKLLVGYVGAAAEEGKTRIYADAELADYIDVPEGSVLHTQDVPDDPLGAQYVWVKKDAEVSLKKADDGEVKARFFSGPLREEAAEATPQPLAPSPSIQQICPTPTSINCPSQLGACPSIDLPCVTRDQTCPSIGTPCVTINSPVCPPPTQKFTCRTKLGCPTDLTLCRTLICPSQLTICGQTRNPIQCVPSQNLLCPVTRNPECVTRGDSCQSQLICPTQICPTQVCATDIPRCLPTSVNCPTFGNCPSAVDACPSGFCPGGGFGPLL